MLDGSLCSVVFLSYKFRKLRLFYNIDFEFDFLFSTKFHLSFVSLICASKTQQVSFVISSYNSSNIYQTIHRFSIHSVCCNSSSPSPINKLHYNDNKLYKILRRKILLRKRFIQKNIANYGKKR